jgi:hypothetical protein
VQFVLQIAHALRDGRLCDAELARGRAHSAALHNRQKIPNLSKAHGAIDLPVTIKVPSSYDVGIANAQMRHRKHDCPVDDETGEPKDKP